MGGLSLLSVAVCSVFVDFLLPASIRRSVRVQLQKLYAYILCYSVVSEESTTAAEEKSGLKVSLKGKRCSSRADF